MHRKKERILKPVKGKGQGKYKGRPIKNTPDFSTETQKDRKPGQGHADSKRTQMPIKATIPCKTLIHPRWRNQNVL